MNSGTCYIQFYNNVLEKVIRLCKVTLVLKIHCTHHWRLYDHGVQGVLHGG